MYRLRFEAKRCPDGVEGYAHRGRNGPVAHLRYCSNRFENVVRELNLEDPIVCRFINANTDEKLFDFLKNFGLLRPAAFQSLQDIVDERYLLRGLLKAAGGDDFRRNIVSASFWIPMKPIVENTAAGNRQLVLIVDKLPSFMRMEIAAVAANGARFAQCQYCGDVFITGKGTAGRSTAKYCRPRCRVYANRDKLKSKGGRHVGAKA